MTPLIGVRVMSELAEAQSQPNPKQDDVHGEDLLETESLEKGLADRQAFAQVEKWMAMIREFSYELPDRPKFGG
jgi:hypothetical protein